MKHIFLFILSLTLLSACSLNQQTKKIKALGDCKYRVYSIDEMRLAGTDVMEMIENRKLDLTQMPGLAMGFLSRNIPLHSTLSFEIINPGNNTAEIETFAYQVWINDFKLTEGTYPDKLTIPASDTVYVPITLETDVYPFLSNDTLRNQIQRFFFSGRENTEQTAKLTFKVKPGIRMGEKIIKYPGFIGFEKELSNKFLFSHGQ